MKRTKRRMTVCTVLLICNLVFIWGNSLLPAEVSGQISGTLKALLDGVFTPGEAVPSGGDGLLRKFAHFAEVGPPKGIHIDGMEAIAELTHDKTVIMIAHRLKTVRHADRIFVVDHGEIVQQGTHDALVAVDGFYRRFVVERQQAAGWKV